MPTSRPAPTPLRWWQTRAIQRILHDLLLVRTQRRYRLDLSTANPLGATDPVRKLVRINPEGVAFPAPAELARIPYAPHAPETFQMAMCRALVEHESGHVVNSGRKPAAPLLGWLWNALEDQRQERIQATNYPELADVFTMLGGAIWLMQPATHRLLDGCLLYRWEWDRPPRDRRFRPLGADQQLWENDVVPRIEQAWAAPTSDAVTHIALDILRVLGLDPQAPIPPDLPCTICACGAGEAHRPPQRLPLPTLPELPATMQPAREPHTAAGALSGDPHDRRQPAEADPSVLQARVAGYQRSVAQALRPIRPLTLPRPSPSRGDLDLERALAGDARPFDAPLAPGPTRDVAVGLLLDLSRSMTHHGIMPSVREVAMLVNGAAELAGIPCAILGFDDGAEPILIRPLSRSHDAKAQRRIAGMEGQGGTRMAPAFQRLVQVLNSASAQRKLLIVLVDGDLTASDTAEMQHALAHLPHGIVLLPCYVGIDQQIIQQVQTLFGKLLDASDLASLRPKLCAWLRGSAN